MGYCATLLMYIVGLPLNIFTLETRPFDCARVIICIAKVKIHQTKIFLANIVY